MDVNPGSQVGSRVQVLVRGGRIVRSVEGDGVRVITVARQPDDVDSAISVRFATALADATGFWQPHSPNVRTLQPDWRGRYDTNAVTSAPMGCLYDSAGATMLGFAVDNCVTATEIRHGVSEPDKEYQVEARMYLAPTVDDVDIVLSGAGEPWYRTAQTLSSWLASRAARPPLPVPASAYEPVFSTWYAFGQDVTADAVELEAAAMREYGMTNVIIDDGWQRFGTGRGYAGCGDWVPDPEKFADLRAHVSALHGLGFRVLLWVAPLLLGRRSEAYQSRLRDHAPRYVDHLDAYVLDPRSDVVRRHVVDTCIRLVSDYDLDGLKIDFLEQASIYGHATEHTEPSVGAAILEALEAIPIELGAAGHRDVLIEYRQPYVSPALGAAANLLRATDCPGDTVMNRVETIDARLVAGKRAVHTDMIMWDHEANSATVGRHLINGFFGVPQISVRSSELSQAHRDTLTFLLGQWRRLSDVTQFGRPDLGAFHENYPIVTCSHPDGRCVVAAFGDIVVGLPDDFEELTILNGSSRDSLVVVSQKRVSVAMIAYTPEGSQVGEPAVLDLGPPLEIAVPAGSVAVLTRHDNNVDDRAGHTRAETVRTK
jgi:alpha-galactosidase